MKYLSKHLRCYSKKIYLLEPISHTKRILSKIGLSIIIFSVSSSLIIQAPLFAFDEEFTIGNDIYYYNPDDTCAPSDGTGVIAPNGATVNVTMAQANIKKNYGSKSQAARYADAMALFSPHSPDFVSLNEIHTPNGQMVYKNYKVLGLQYPGARSVEDEGVRIAWDADRWKKTNEGLEMIHPSTLKNGIAMRDRYAIWGSFQNLSSGATVSVVSTHWNVGSQKRPGVANKEGQSLKKIAQTLFSRGPVLIGGDFNFPLSEFDVDHSPAQILKPIGLRSAFSKPDDRDVNIDTIFYPEHFTLGSKQTYSKSRTSPISDHPFILAKFSGSGGASVVDNNGCVCRSSTSATNLVGYKNDEKIYNYFIGKGLSPVQAAGIIGNIAIESGFDPQRIQGKGIGEGSKNPNDAGTSGWGLIQWTPGSKVITAANQAGLGNKPIHELATQLDLIWGHMQNKPPITKGSFSIPEYKKITNIEAAVNYFEDKIEGAGSPNYPDRYTAARLALDQYNGNVSTSSPGSATNANISDCGSVGNGAAAGDAVQTALNYAWSKYHSPNYTKLKPAYAEAVSQASKKGEYVGGGRYPGVDCGGFITLVMRNSGVDPKYGAGGNTTIQEKYLATSGKYTKIDNPTTANLTPGAIAIKSNYGGDSGGGHTYMYVGKQSGFETQVASASYSGTSNSAWRSPMAGHELVADPNYDWYVLK